MQTLANMGQIRSKPVKDVRLLSLYVTVGKYWTNIGQYVCATGGIIEWFMKCLWCLKGFSLFGSLMSLWCVNRLNFSLNSISQWISKQKFSLNCGNIINIKKKNLLFWLFRKWCHMIQCKKSFLWVGLHWLGLTSD